MPPQRQSPKNIEKPIDIADIPEDVQAGIEFLRSLTTKEQWREVTGGMNDITKQFFIVSRGFNQTQRNRAAREYAKQLRETELDISGDENFLRGVLATFYLTDEQLDLAIATLDAKKMD